MRGSGRLATMKQNGKQGCSSAQKMNCSTSNCCFSAKHSSKPSMIITHCEADSRVKPIWARGCKINFFSWTSIDLVTTAGSDSMTSSILSLRAGILMASWYARVANSRLPVLRSRESREKKKVAARSPYSWQSSAIVCESADFPAPAGPCNRSTLFCLCGSFIQPKMFPIMVVRVFG